MGGRGEGRGGEGEGRRGGEGERRGLSGPRLPRVARGLPPAPHPLLLLTTRLAGIPKDLEIEIPKEIADPKATVLTLTPTPTTTLTPTLTQTPTLTLTLTPTLALTLTRCPPTGTRRTTACGSL